MELQGKATLVVAESSEEEDVVIGAAAGSAEVDYAAAALGFPQAPAAVVDLTADL